MRGWYRAQCVAKPWKEYGRYGSVGIEMVLSIVLGLWLGGKADERFGTAPWLALLGFVVGVYAAFKALFTAARKMQKDIDLAERRDRGEDIWAEERARARRPPPAAPRARERVEEAGDASAAGHETGPRPPS
jgi:F0F1-type ATP synthase assembly protein I